MEGNKGFTDKMREVEGGSIIHCKFFAEVDIFLIEALNLNGDIIDWFLIFLVIVLYVFIVLSHHLLAHLVEPLHLIEIETESNRSHFVRVLDVRIGKKQFVETCS